MKLPWVIRDPLSARRNFSAMPTRSMSQAKKSVQSKVRRKILNRQVRSGKAITSRVETAILSVYSPATLKGAKTTPAASLLEPL